MGATLLLSFLLLWRLSLAVPSSSPLPATDGAASVDYYNVLVAAAHALCGAQGLDRLRIQLKLLLTDGASVMLKFGNMLRELIPELIHLTCACHQLSLVANKIRDTLPKADSFVHRFTDFLAKSTNAQAYRAATGLALPPSYVATRWGLWLKAVAFINENIQLISEFLAGNAEHDETAAGLSASAIKTLVREQLTTAAAHLFVSDMPSKS